jgi:hypothetical protein
MKLEQVLEDVEKFKLICKEEGLKGCSFLGCLLFELCLRAKGIEAVCVVGYLIVDNTHWVLHSWNEYELDDGKKRKIDVSVHPHINFEFTKKYLLYLRGNQIPMMKDNKELKDDHDLLCDINNKYITRGPIFALEWTKARTQPEVLESWKRIIDRVKTMETFESIENYIIF